MTAPVRITAGQAGDSGVLRITVNDWETGGIILRGSMIIAAVRHPWIGMHRFRKHESVTDALAMVLASRMSRRRGAGPGSDIRWSDAAAQIAFETTGASHG